MTNRGAEGTPAGEIVHAPRGTALSCKGWEQEAVLRMLMNCADSEVAERRGTPIAGGASAGAGNAARDWDGFRATLAVPRDLENDQTLLVRAAQPVVVFRTRAAAQLCRASRRTASPTPAKRRRRAGFTWVRRPACPRRTRPSPQRRENILAAR